MCTFMVKCGYTHFTRSDRNLSNMEANTQRTHRSSFSNLSAYRDCGGSCVSRASVTADAAMLPLHRVVAGDSFDEKDLRRAQTHICDQGETLLAIYRMSSANTWNARLQRAMSWVCGSLIVPVAAPLACYLACHEHRAAAEGTTFVVTDVKVYRHVDERASSRMPLSQAWRKSSCAVCLEPPTGYQSGTVQLSKIEAVGIDVDRLERLDGPSGTVSAAKPWAGRCLFGSGPGECTGCIGCPVHYVAFAVAKPLSSNARGADHMCSCCRETKVSPDLQSVTVLMESEDAAAAAAELLKKAVQAVRAGKPALAEASVMSKDARRQRAASKMIENEEMERDGAGEATTAGSAVGVPTSTSPGAPPRKRVSSVKFFDEAEGGSIAC